MPAAAPPKAFCRVVNSTTQNIPTGAWTAVTFDLERYDPLGMHSQSTNTSRIVVPETGFYKIGGGLAFSDTDNTPGVQVGGTGKRGIAVRMNGATFIAVQYATPLVNQSWFLTVHTAYYLTAGQYVELMAYQDGSAAGINSMSFDAWAPEFWVHRQS